jgi:penicillin-binding protein 1A
VAKISKNKNKPRRSASILRSRWILWVGLGLIFLAAMLCLVYGFWASTFDMHEVRDMSERSTVFDMDGKVYSRMQGENRVTVKLSEVSPNFIKALLAREDSRFYQHRGVDLFGILRAIFRNFTHHSAKEGASTITQQLARNSFPERLGTRKSLHRKLLEAFVALRIEQNYSKEEILENYVNRIYLGSEVYGVETASQRYFGKRASDLTIGEAAMIAGIIRAPTRFSPLKNMKAALRERDTVLDRLVKLDKISEAQAAAARSTPITLTKKRPFAAQDNYVMDLVRRQLDDLLTDDQKQDGGMKIYTTIDPALQGAAEKAVDLELAKIEARPGYKHPKKSSFAAEARAEEQEPAYLQGALVVIDNRNGAIRALVGGRDFKDSKFNRAIADPPKRQVCSTFKPFVYAAAFQKGLLPGALIDDGPIARGEIREAVNWTPGNSDGSFKGQLRLEEGLIQSRNTMSVRVGEKTGIADVVKLALNAGFENIPKLPSIFLGAFEANVLDVTSAYSVFANNGLKRPSYVIERIDDAGGETIYRAKDPPTKALDPGVCWMVTSTLTKVLERGTAASARSLGFNKPAAGKTGTNDDYRDAWFVGYTTSLTCGVWVGLDKPETIISHGYGATLALPVWVDVMNAASSQRYPANAFQSPVPLRRVTVCSSSNKLATNGCERAGTAYTIDLPETRIPQDTCGVHQGAVIAGGQPRDSRNPEPKRSAPENILRSFKKFFFGN